MTLPLFFAIFLEATSLTLLAVVLRRQVWSHLGALFVMAAVLYHGVGEIVNRIGAPGAERASLSDAQLDQWQVLVGSAIFLFTIGYLVTLGRHRRRPTAPVDQSAVSVTTRFFSWKILAIVSLPMYIYVLAGKSVSLGQAATDHTQAGLVSEFILIATALTSYSYVVAKGPSVILRVCVVQSLLLLLLGERLTVAAAAIMLLYALARAGFRARRRQVTLTVLLLVMAAVVLSASRVTVGRQAYTSGSGPLKRLDSVFSGIKHPGAVFDNFSQQYFNRIDGNDFATYTVVGMHYGISPVGLQTFDNDIRLAIPSAISPSKLSASATARDEEFAFESRYEMPPMNRLPTTLGTLVGYFGPRWFEVLAVLLGLLFALADRCLRRLSPVRLIVGVGIVGCIAQYEGSPATYLTTLRGVLLLLMVAKAVELLRAFAPTSRFPVDMTGIGHIPAGREPPIDYRAQQVLRPPARGNSQRRPLATE